MSFASSRTLALGVLLVAYASTVASLPGNWWQAHPHGFAVLALCLWLGWRDREQLRSVDRRLSATAATVAMAALAGLSMLWLVAAILSAQLVQQTVLPLLAVMWLLCTAGVAPLRRAAPIAAAFLLAVPIWGVLTRPLQTLTVFTNDLLLRLVRIDAAIDGDFIRIAAGTFHVAEGCAGLEYFQIGLLVGVSYALLFLRTWRARIVVMAITVASVVVMNWLRVFGLIVIGHATEMRSSLMQAHGTYGWLLFGVALMVALYLAQRVERAEERRLALATPPSATSDTGRTPTQPDVAALSRGRLVVATALAVLGPALFTASAAWANAGRTTPPSLASVPAPTGWHVDADSSPSLFTPAFRAADHHDRTRWRNSEGAIQVDRLLYLTQRQGKELVMYGNQIAPDSLQLASGSARPAGPSGATVSATVVRTESGPRLVLWWYRVSNEVTASATRAKLLELRAFARRSPPAELVAVSSPCSRQDCRDAGLLLGKYLEASQLLRP